MNRDDIRALDAVQRVLDRLRAGLPAVDDLARPGAGEAFDKFSRRGLNGEDDLICAACDQRIKRALNRGLAAMGVSLSSPIRVEPPAQSGMPTPLICPRLR
ncbi:MAG: hypothetical protein R2912_07215 [Eubacteriales bacterium]